MKKARVFLISFALVLWETAYAVAPQDTTGYTAVVSTEPEEAYTVGPSTPTPQQLKQMRQQRPRKAPMREIRAMERKIKRVIKKTKPNPKVQAPSAYPLPVNAPTMPTRPPMPPQPSRTERFLGAVAKIITKTWGANIFVWLPAVSTDPNAGPTGGVLPVLVLADSKTRHIRQLVAPSYTYNGLFGQTGTMRYYWYPTDASQFVTIGSFSQNTNRTIKVRYENTSLADGILYLRTEAYHDVDGSKRFFGLGPQTHEGDESGYTGNDTVAHAALGINFFRYWRATMGERFRRLVVNDTVVPNISELTARFPNLTGLSAENTVSTEFHLLWDSRDLPITPSRGSSGELFIEKTSVAMGSDSDYFRYGLEGKRFFLWENPNHVTVLRGLFEKVNGSNIPFYELPSLGGRDTLRGYGDGRLTDSGRVVVNVEHRMTVASLSIMGIQTNFEVAPFFDLGTVFPTATEVQRKNFRPVYGSAFRAAVKPNVVGDVEVGIGKEGPAVFVSIDYPY